VITYRSKITSAFIWACVLTSPGWLVIPVFSVFTFLWCLFPPYNTFNIYAKHPLHLIGEIFIYCAYFGSFAAVTLFSSDKRLVASDAGLRLPIYLTLLNRCKNNIAWTNILSMQVVGDVNGSYDRLQLRIDTTNGHVYKLKLGAMATQDVEKLLLAAEIWLPEGAKTPLLQSLQDKFAVLALPGRERSHRQLVADELDSRFTSAAFIPLEPGQTLDGGRLVVVRQIAFGGLSAVYLVQEDNQGLFVLKESVIPNQSKDELRQKAYELFRREVELLKRLEHPNIVKVARAFRENEREYLLLQYVPGESLRQMVRENGPRPQSEMLTWAISLSETLAYLHGMEPAILHRDLTPENIIVAGNNVPVIIDFGVANELISNATATLVGKHCYIAPEQFRGQALPQSDIYSLGGTLHFLLTGHDPVPLSQSIPHQVDATISEGLSKVVADMTNLDLSQRIATTSELLERLKQCAV